MAQYTTEAVLLAVRNWGDADKMVTFFSRDLGKVRAVAYGCRRPRSPLAGGMQAFSHLRLQVTEGGQLDVIRQCETKRSFRELREDLAAMAYASFVAETAAELCPERRPEPQVYDILLAAFAVLAQRNPRLTALAAAYQLLESAGFQPDYAHCRICQRAIEADALFSLELGGAVCWSCGAADARPFSVKLQGFIGNLLRLDWRNPASFTVSGAVLQAAERLLLDVLLRVLEKPLKSLAFIHQLAALPKR